MAENKPNTPKKNPYAIYWIYALVVLGIIFATLFTGDKKTKDLHIDTFYGLAEQGFVRNVQLVNNTEVKFQLTEKGIEHIKKHPKGSLKTIKKALESGAKYGANNSKMTFVCEIISPMNFETKLDEVNKVLKENHKPSVQAKPVEEINYAGSILNFLIPIILIFALWMFFMRRMGGGGGGPGGQIFNIGRSKAQVYENGKTTNVTFKDVAGLQGAKEEIQEIVEFLKNSKKYTELGAKIPKGALLVGPPGTGKTLLAKAVAGEAKVPFFSLSGSDFVEMFVGVGASRVRDLFRQAKEKAPCIIFIDEIDAIGRARGKGAGFSSNDERENTLNQLLTEMDGFGTNSGVIILAATNRADVLDSALMRAGRFDRQIYVDMPDIIERNEIFQVHLKPLKLGNDIDVDFLSKQTPGFSGADIANLCNEAALIAARKEKKSVEKQDFLDAVDRIIGGLEKKNKIITKGEKRAIAFHEAGHATTSWLLEHAHPLVKVTIVPRGRSLGAAWYLPEERSITTTEQLLDDMCSALGGRAAEQLMFGKISTGALSDLEKVTKQAYAMVSIYGLNDRVGNISYYDSRGSEMFTKPYSDVTARVIDEEVSKLIESQYQRALQILTDNKDKLILLAEKLLETEVIFKEDLELIFGKREWDFDVIEDAKVVEPETEEKSEETNTENSEEINQEVTSLNNSEENTEENNTTDTSIDSTEVSDKED